MKYLIWIGLFVIILLLMRLLSPVKHRRREEGNRGKGNQGPGRGGRAAADATEQAIVHALWHAEPVRGRDGHKRHTLREILRRLPDEDNPCAS